jgi:hypothetical protein
MAVKLWAFTTFECVKTLRGHDHNVSAVCFLPSGDQVSARDALTRAAPFTRGIQIADGRVWCGPGGLVLPRSQHSNLGLCDRVRTRARGWRCAFVAAALSRASRADFLQVLHTIAERPHRLGAMRCPEPGWSVARERGQRPTRARVERAGAVAVRVCAVGARARDRGDCVGTRCCPFDAARSTCSARGVGERPAATSCCCAG